VKGSKHVVIVPVHGWINPICQWNTRLISHLAAPIKFVLRLKWVGLLYDKTVFTAHLAIIVVFAYERSRSCLAVPTLRDLNKILLYFIWCYKITFGCINVTRK